jgi:hypothetical protein
MMHNTFAQMKSYYVDLLNSLEDLGVITTAKSSWMATRILAHAWFGLIANFQDLPKVVGINLYAAQLEINKSNERDRYADRFLPLDDQQI